MACDEGLVERIRQELQDQFAYGEKRMFGGVCFTLHGNMFCGVVKDDLMVRVGPDGYHAALKQPHAREMDFTGKSMRGYVFVSSAGLSEDKALSDWVGTAMQFARGLPRKSRAFDPKRAASAA